MKKRCTILSSSSCSSSSSSSCIDSPASQNNNETKKSRLPKIIDKPKKHVRAKKTVNFAGGAPDNSVTSPKSRSSIYRGVTRHRWTGRYEAHLWDKTTWNSIQNKRGRQIYLGAYDNEKDAARTYDLAALKYWGPTSILNFPLDMYTKEFEEMQKLTKEEFLASLRRRSSGFSRGVSKYRGVARHHHNGRWEARIGRVSGNKYLYLGTYDTQEEAAAAYDMAAIEFRGPKAVTNFDISSYADKFKEIPVEVQGIKDEQIQVKQEQHNIIIPDSFDQVVQANETHDQDFVQIQPNILKLELMDSMDSDVMDPTEQQHAEHLWDHLSLDDVDFINSLPIPDIPLETAASDLLELFDDKGFEEDIEFIFDGTFGDFDENLQDEMYGTDIAKVETADDLVGPQVTGVSRTPSSSSLSTMTSVCSDM